MRSGPKFCALTIDPDAESITLVSREIADPLTDGFQLISRGSHLVKGNRDSLEVWQLGRSA